MSLDIFEIRNRIYHRKKLKILMLLVTITAIISIVRLGYLMLYDDYYGQKAIDLHERERDIKAARGRIIDRNGIVLADNVTVCTISVVHSQIEAPEEVIKVLSEKLDISEDKIRARVEKISSIERIKSNVSKNVGDEIRSYHLAGVKVDEDYKRDYPYDDLASKVIGFTGSDNQGIIGLEVKYDQELSGRPGKILTITDAKGVELSELGERRLEPLKGDDLVISLDYNIQKYAQQLAEAAYESKHAESVNILVMNPKNGEIYAMVGVPEFNLNDPFTLPVESQQKLLEGADRQDLLNRMWRNECINDTYEPGSIFKIITASAAFEAGVLSENDSFYCPGYTTVADRRIRCAKVQGHGQQTFTEAVMNSCNPAFINIGLRVGTDNYYKYLNKFEVLNKTGIDLPGEAGTIMHKQENVGPLELATMSFGQSFQITPLRLATTVSAIINGGTMVTPHLALRSQMADGTITQAYYYETREGIVAQDTSEKMRRALYQVVTNGGGKNGYVEGYAVGGKTATSQTLPRNNGVYIAAFLGFAPADNPEVLAIAIINHPEGIYYGGQISAPVVRQLYENILPYLDIQKETNEDSENIFIRNGEQQ